MIIGNLYKTIAYYNYFEIYLYGCEIGTESKYKILNSINSSYQKSTGEGTKIVPSPIFLLLEECKHTCKVLYKNKIGWIDIDTGDFSLKEL